MTRKNIETVIKKVISVANKVKTKIVFIGGIAINILLKPRTTYDIDFFVSLFSEDKIKIFLNQLTNIGFKMSSPVKLFQNFKFVSLYDKNSKIYLDIFFPVTEFQNNVIRRAKKVKFGKYSFYVATAEDMILLKLLSLRERDMEDVRELLQKKIDLEYLKRTAKKLGVIDLLSSELKK